MAAPTLITELSQTIGSNGPAGSVSPIEIDNYLRAHAGFIALTNAALGTGTVAGFTQSGTGAVATTVQAKLRESVSVKDFGATGDGTTNDYAAIMAAHDALPSTGGTIFAPRGIYKHTSSLAFTKRIRLVGEGTHYVNGASSATEFLKAFNGEGVVLSGPGSVIEACGFRGDTGNTGDGIVIKAGRVSLVDVMTCAMGNDGIRIGTDAGGENCNLWYLERIKSKNNGRDGVRISEGSGTGSDANGGTFNHADLQSNTGSGLYLASCQLNTFTGIVSQSNAYGYYLTADAEYNSFFGGDPEASGTKDIFITSGATGNRFFGQPVLATNVSDNEATTLMFVADQYKLGRGLQFPAAQVASTNANTLDDYEEGTWTPVITFVTPGNVSVAYTTQNGRYTKIGRQVTLEFDILTSAFTHTTASGNLRVTGVVGIGISAALAAVGSCLAGGWTLASVSSLSSVILGDVLQFYASRSGAASVALTATEVPTGGTVSLAGTIVFNV